MDVKIKSLKFLNVKKSGGTVEFFDLAGTLLHESTLPKTGKKSYRTIRFDVMGVRRIRITLTGPGAIDDVSIWRDCDHVTAVTSSPTVCKEDYKVDFSKRGDGTPLAHGDVLDDSVDMSDLVIKARRAGSTTGVYRDGMILDTQSVSVRDKDLMIPSLGNIFIISKDGDSSDPDDSADGGEIIMTFHRPVMVKGLRFVDIEEMGGTVELFGEVGTRLNPSPFMVPRTGNGKHKMLWIKVLDVKKMRIKLVGSGAIDDVLIWSDCKSAAPSLAPATASPTVCVDDYNIDFSELGDGTRLKKGDGIDGSKEFNGVTFAARRRERIGVDGPFVDGMVFDTSQVSGGDDDLRTKLLGNVMIISQDNDGGDPDDNGDGGEIVARFRKPSKVRAIRVLDMEAGGFVECFDQMGRLLSTVEIPKTANGEQVVVRVQQAGVTKMKIVLDGSGALTNVMVSRDCMEAPTTSPTHVFTVDELPSSHPTSLPSAFPSIEPTKLPTDEPTSEPTLEPTTLPSSLPSLAPSVTPTTTGSPTPCSIDYTITFDTNAFGRSLGKGDVIDDSVPFNGVRFAARRKQESRDGPFDDGMIFDTRIPGGSDSDLAEDPTRGNILIISKDGDSDAPNDNGKGGTIIANFTRPVMLRSLRLIDVEDGATLLLYGPDGSVVDVIVVLAGFPDGSKGDIIDDTVQFNGVTFAARRRQDAPDGPFDDGMIFDTRMPSGGDDDLGVDGRGNILIISKNGNSDDPNDNGKGGAIVANFTRPVTVRSVKLIDVEDGATMVLYDRHGDFVDTVIAPSGSADGSLETLSIGVSGVKSFTFELHGSGGIDDLEVSRPCATEAPTTAPSLNPSERFSD